MGFFSLSHASLLGSMRLTPHIWSSSPPHRPPLHLALLFLPLLLSPPPPSFLPPYDLCPFLNPTPRPKTLLYSSSILLLLTFSPCSNSAKYLTVHLTFWALFFRSDSSCFFQTLCVSALKLKDELLDSSGVIKFRSPWQQQLLL